MGISVLRLRRIAKRLLGPKSGAASQGDGLAAHAGGIFVPPGHFYSPIPSRENIDSVERRGVRVDSLPGIDLDEPGQLDLLEQLAKFYPSTPFTDDGSPGYRYKVNNVSYSYADGIFLYTLLRHLRPRRIIEVGSGYTSALTLDTNEHFLDGRLECCFIEPYPDLLFSLIADDDRDNAEIIRKPLQSVDLAVFDRLRSGDLLFIDSTHVAKANSDVNCLFFEILPRLAVGTFVHIHDVFPGFEYPVEWLPEGRAWNEQYLLRGFLQFNGSFRVRLFGSHMIRRHPEWFQSHMPLCLRNPGGAFWMERMR